MLALNSKPLYVFALVLILVSGILTCAYAQPPEFKISGSVNGSAIGYGVSGIPARRDPFYWLVSSNLTLSYWKITAPLTFTVSQQDHTFRYPQPFNQFGISPKYKSVTFHIGYRSLNFSEFTLAGTIFMGGGVEVAPPNGSVKVSAMYGRLAKARLVGGINDLEFGIPSFERWGYGTKVTLGKNGQEVDFIVFRGRDDPSSIDAASAARLGITPAENFVSGLNVRRNLSKRVNLNVEYALSAYTKDIRDPEQDAEYTYANYLGGLYTPRISSQFNSAFQGQLTYRAEKYQLNAKYRRLGPEYKTMGSPFMNNDFEDISGGAASAFFQNKLNVSVNAGVQRNNLTNTQEARQTRFIGSINTSITASDRLNITLSYSNFNSTTTQTRFFQQSQVGIIDSLLYLQVTNNFTAGASYSLQQGAITKSIVLNSNYQVASDNQNNNSVFYNANAGYVVNMTAKDLSINTNMNINSNRVAGLENISAGPTLSASKMLMEKKIRTTFSSSYIQTYQMKELTSSNITARLGGSYTTKTKHTFGIDLSWLHRVGTVASMGSFSEFRGGVTYNYSFSN
ncbi:MAG: hypothetical protein K2U26_20125 [Cyclobacteriaceae bacterium]|nr:hypothetical protein [Cyclobacteriaceae bacterium]